MGVGFKDVAEDCNSRDFGKWVQERRRQIKTQEHVTVLDRRETRNAGTVESNALGQEPLVDTGQGNRHICLLYTSDAADDLLCVDLGGRRIIKKKKNNLNIRT